MTLTDAGQLVEPARIDRRTRNLEITARHVELLRARSTDQHPDGPRWMPATEFTDPELLRLERARLRETPLVVAHGSQLPNPGSFHTERVLGVPVLLVRQADGSVRAFLNSCAHRGARLLEGSGEVRARMVCGYHAWSYHPDGRLASVSQEHKFGGLDGGCTGLTELPCAQRHGMVFTCLTPGRELDVDAFLGDLGPHLELAALDELALADRKLEDQRINWKVALSTYYESYHLKTVHAATIGDHFIGNQSTHEVFGPNGEHAVTTWAMAQVKDLLELSDEQLAETTATFGPFLTVLFIFPNTVITSPDPGFMRMAHLIRVDPGATPSEQLTDFRVLTPPGLAGDAKAAIDMFTAVTIHALENEDYFTGVGVQEALDSGIKDGLRIGANEPTLTDLYRAWARWTGRADPDRPLAR
jgi:phenylpropionate dioxygenase-like ring-hydroxylating dioxygenase large terminal subunit